MKAIIAIAWLCCGLIGAGFDNAYFQRKWPEQCNGRQDLGKSMIGIIGGPVYLMMAYLHSGFGEYGWSLNSAANPRCEYRK